MLEGRVETLEFGQPVDFFVFIRPVPGYIFQFLNCMNINNKEDYKLSIAHRLLNMSPLPNKQPPVGVEQRDAKQKRQYIKFSSLFIAYLESPTLKNALQLHAESLLASVDNLRDDE